MPAPDDDVTCGQVHGRWRFAPLVLALGCTSGDPPIVERSVADGIAAAVARGPGARLALGAVTGGRRWTQAYVFGPYTPPELIARCVGARADRTLTRGIDARDDANLLVFTVAEGPPQSMAVSRASGDFGPEARARRYTPETAVFVVRAPSPGRRGDLVPVGDGAGRCR